MADGDYIVADTQRIFTFRAGDPWPDILAGIAPFSVAPASIKELANLPTNGRPDLLVGRVFGATLRFQALNIGLEPLCSTVVHRVVEAFELDGCERVRIDGDPDTINTPRELITGSLPEFAYHGTSDTNLAVIKREGLRIDQPANWEHGGREHVYLAAEAQVSAFHARRTAGLLKGKPVVLKCRFPTIWLADHDVQSMMVNNPLVPSNDGRFLAQEAGLFAAPDSISGDKILEVRSPQHSSRFDAWPIVEV